MKQVIFICTGNTCRSPMAEGIFKKLYPNADIRSAGLAAFAGDSVTPNAVLAVEQFGVDIKNHKATPFSPYMVTPQTLFVCMTDSHKAALQSIGVLENQIEVLNVPDPYGQSLEVYKNCALNIYRKLVLLGFKLNGTLIRPFCKGDEVGVAKIEKECFSVPWSETAVLESFNNNVKFFVAEKNSEIVGYCGLQLTEQVGFVTNIAVLPAYRNYGLGSALISEMINLAKSLNLDEISLEVRVSNQTAVNIYQKIGFKNLGVRKNFYSNPKEDAYIYTYYLKECNK